MLKRVTTEFEKLNEEVSDEKRLKQLSSQLQMSPASPTPQHGGQEGRYVVRQRAPVTWVPPCPRAPPLLPRKQAAHA